MYCNNPQLYIIRVQPFNLKGGGAGVMVFCTDLNFFLFNSWTHFYFFSIAIKLNYFFFLPSQNSFFFNALYKGVSQYSFLDVMHIAHIYTVGQKKGYTFNFYLFILHINTLIQYFAHIPTFSRDLN